MLIGQKLVATISHLGVIGLAAYGVAELAMQAVFIKPAAALQAVVFGAIRHHCEPIRAPMILRFSLRLRSIAQMSMMVSTWDLDEGMLPPPHFSSERAFGLR